MRTWIQHATIITPDQSIADSVVIIEDERILAIESRIHLTDFPDQTEIIDATNLFVMPGLIDIHVHGGAGSDTMDATPDCLKNMSNFFVQHGVTSFLPTTGSQSFEAISRAVENFAQNKTGYKGAQPLGIHLEGPYLCDTYRGAHPSKWLRDPNPKEYNRWFKTGVIRSMTIAPELPGAFALIKQGVRNGIHFAAGHTAATPQQIHTAADAGLNLSTHTFNGMAGLHHRDLGTVGAMLADDRIFCEIIADGIHVHPAILQMVFKIKGMEHTILVTDAIRAAGMTDGVYELVGQSITVNNGIARTEAGGLAGSTLTLEKAVNNMRQFSSLSINQAVRLATLTPASALGLKGSKGEIRSGADADILIADSEMNIKAVLIGGKVVFRSTDFIIEKE